jgi:hypothetical protein
MSGKARGRTRNKPAKAAVPGATAPRAKQAGVDQYIAGQLRAIYNEVAAEPIPDRLLQLLDRLNSDGKN